MNPSAPSNAEPLHAQIGRFAKLAEAEMSVDLAAEIIGIHRQTVVSLCQHKRIEVCTVAARGECRRKYTITKAALLAYLVRNTHGPRDAIMAAIEQSCPQWRTFAQQVASGARPEMAPLNAHDAKRARPKNVIDLSTHQEFSFVAGLSPAAAEQQQQTA